MKSVAAQGRITKPDFHRAHRLRMMLDAGPIAHASEYDAAKWIYKAWIAYCVLNELEPEEIATKAGSELEKERS